MRVRLCESQVKKKKPTPIEFPANFEKLLKPMQFPLSPHQLDGTLTLHSIRTNKLENHIKQTIESNSSRKQIKIQWKTHIYHPTSGVELTD